MTTPSSNNIDPQQQHSLEMNQLQNSMAGANPAMSTPPGMNSMAPPPGTETPPPNIGLSPHQLNSSAHHHAMGNATPSPNTGGISTSGDPTPALPSVSISPSSHSGSPMLMNNIVPSPGMSPYHQQTHLNNVYSRMGVPPGGMATPMDGRLASYGQGPPPTRHYVHPNMMGGRSGMMGHAYHHPHQIGHPAHPMSHHQPMPPPHHNSLGDPAGFPVMPPQHNSLYPSGPRPPAMGLSPQLAPGGGVPNQPPPTDQQIIANSQQV